MDAFYATLQDLDSLGGDQFPTDLFPTMASPNTAVSTDDVIVAALKTPSPLPVPKEIVSAPAPASTALTMETFFSGLKRTNELALDTINRAMVGVNTRFNRVDESIASLNTAANSVGRTVSAVREDVSEVKQQQNALAQQLAILQAEIHSRPFTSAAPVDTVVSHEPLAHHETILLKLFFSGAMCFSKTDAEGNVRIVTGALEEFRSPANVQLLSKANEEFGGVSSEVSISSMTYIIATADNETCARYLYPVATTFDDDFAIANHLRNRGGLPLVPISALESEELADATVHLCRRTISFLTKNAYGSRNGLQVLEVEKVLNGGGIEIRTDIPDQGAYPFWFNTPVNHRRPMFTLDTTPAQMAAILHKALAYSEPIFTSSTQHSTKYRSALYPGFFRSLWSRKQTRPAYVGARQMDIQPVDIQFLADYDKEDSSFAPEAEEPETNEIDMTELELGFAALDNDLNSADSILGKRSGSPCASPLPNKRLRSDEDIDEQCPIDMIHDAWRASSMRTRKSPKTFVADNIVLCIGHPKWSEIEREWRVMLACNGDDVPQFCGSMKALYYR